MRNCGCYTTSEPNQDTKQLEVVADHHHTFDVTTHASKSDTDFENKMDTNIVATGSLCFHPKHFQFDSLSNFMGDYRVQLLCDGFFRKNNSNPSDVSTIVMLFLERFCEITFNPNDMQGRQRLLFFNILFNVPQK